MDETYSLGVRPFCNGLCAYIGAYKSKSVELWPRENRATFKICCLCWNMDREELNKFASGCFELFDSLQLGKLNALGLKNSVLF